MSHPESDGTPCRDPANGELLGHSPLTTSDELAAVIERARMAQPAWAALPVAERARAIRRVRDHVTDHAEEIAEIIARDSGKTRVDALLTEVISCSIAADFYAHHARRFLRERRLPLGSPLLVGKRPRLVRQPFGLVGIISPWNYPMTIPFSEVVMALLAGNAVILKTASETQLTGRRLERCFSEAGLPDGIFNFVNLPGREAGPAFLRHRVDKLFFTGSVAVGKKLMAAAAETLTPLVLELGGKDSMLICEDADLQRAAEGAVWAGLQNCGQSCGGIERIYVHEQVWKPFIDILAGELRTLRVAGGGLFDTDLGVMTTASQAESVKSQVDDALAKGATIFAEALPLTEGPQRLPALLLTDVDATMRIMNEETFGPVLCAMPVRDMDEAVALANDSPFGLTASVWTRDRRRGGRIARRLRTGVVTVNDHLVSHGMPGTPWGGIGDSGFGRTHGKLGFDEMSQAQVVVQDLLPLVRRNLWWYPHDKQLYKGLAGALRLFHGRGFLKRLIGLAQLFSILPRLFTRRPGGKKETE